MMMVDRDRNDDDDDDVREGGVLRFIKSQFCRMLTIQIILVIIYIFYKLIHKIVNL